MCYLFDSKKRAAGKLFIQNFSVNSHYSFIDLYIKKSLNIVPIIAVDFSLANLDCETQTIFHTLKEGSPNDYMDCLKTVSKTFHYFNRFMLPIGFGARPLVGTKERGPTSNLFSMTGDFADPFIETHDELINCYEGTIKSVQLDMPVMYQEVMKFVIDIAQNEMNKSNGVIDLQNYFVVIILMAGLIDDFEDTLNQMLKAANLPISIIIIQIGKNTQENDSEKFINEAFPAFEKSERVYVDLLDFDSYKNE